MNEEYRIVHVDQPGQAEWRAVGGGISAYNEQHAGDDNKQFLCYVLRSPGDEIVGGAIGVTHYDWLHIDLLWIREDLRGRGYGHRLLTLAEDKARERGARNAYLDTFDFQAPAFYKKHGYEVFGELPDFPAGHRRIYLTKEL